MKYLCILIRVFTYLSIELCKLHKMGSLDVSIVCCSNFPFSIYITFFAVVL